MQLIDPTNGPDEVLGKIDKLSAEILGLHERIQEVMALVLELARTQAQLQAAIRQSDEIVDKIAAQTTTWTQDLANRYTFLLSLREWLQLVGTEAPDDPDRNVPPPA